jgi:adenosylmethionine---8-amino-7-oxononanoate aminotransferase
MSRLKPKLYKFFLEAGILLRPLGNILYVLPPYVISSDDLHFIYDRISDALALCELWSDPPASMESGDHP